MVFNSFLTALAVDINKKTYKKENYKWEIPMFNWYIKTYTLCEISQNQYIYIFFLVLNTKYLMPEDGHCGGNM
jgi:hypothetical protein